MLLVIGAIVIFSLLALSINSSLTNSSVQSANAEYISMATNLGQSWINKISTKAFDEKTLEFPAYSPSVLTPVESLGPDSGEPYSTDFDDVDDFNGFDTTVTTSRTGDFKIFINVHYVNENNLTQISSVPTRTKGIEVKVTSEFFRFADNKQDPDNPGASKQDTVKLYYYKSY